MHEGHHLEGLEPSEFSYRGVDVAVGGPQKAKADTATVEIGDRRYEVKRHGEGMWMAPGVFNMYSSLGELARHMIDLDLQGLLPPPGELQRQRSRRKR